MLLADSGQTIYAHTCLKKNRTSISLTNAATCCHKKVAGKESCSFKKQNCCQVNSTLVKQVVPGRVQTGGQFKIVLQSFVAVEIFEAYNSSTIVFICGNHRSSAPEPLGKADILFTQVFRC